MLWCCWLGNTNSIHISLQHNPRTLFEWHMPRRRNKVCHKDCYQVLVFSLVKSSVFPKDSRDCSTLRVPVSSQGGGWSVELMTDKSRIRYRYLRGPLPSNLSKFLTCSGQFSLLILSAAMLIQLSSAVDGHIIYSSNIISADTARL